MFIVFLGWEVFTEIVPVGEPFLDWYISMRENHLWLGPLHVVFNRVEALQ